MGSLVEDYLDLERRALEVPNSVSLFAPNREPLSWLELWRHIRLASEEFERAGIVPRSVAVLALPNGPEFISAFLAITLQAACAPLDLALTRDEYSYYLSKINAATLVFAEGVNPAVLEAAGELGMRLIRIHRERESPAGVFSMEKLCDDSSPGRRETTAAVLLHTSATTNIPKLVPLSRDNLRAVVAQDHRTLQITGTDRFLSLTPLCHAHGLAATLTQLACGGGVCCGSAFSPGELLACLNVFRPTWTSAGTPVLRTLLALARDNPEIFRRISLRFIRSTGATGDPELLDEFQKVVGVPLLNGYGLTEVCGVTRNTLTMNREGSAGRSSGPELAICNDAGKFLPVETEGEIVLRGPALTVGYLDDPQANREAFRDGWFHTGDIGRMDRDGFLFIAGRKKEMISRGGKKISPLEVDNVLLRHPALADAATFPIPHRTLEQEPATAVVLRPGAQVTSLELRRFAAQQLAAYKVPRKIVFVPEIPHATTGKPKRAALAEQFRDLGAPASAGHFDSASTELEKTLIGLWQKVLGVDQIDTGNDFFDLGGDSLSAAHMLTQATGAFHLGRQLPEAEFFEEPTIAALARSITKMARENGGQPAIENRVLILQDKGSDLPIFCFSTNEDDAYQFRHLAQWLGREHPFTVVCPAHPLQGDRLSTIEEIARQAVRSIRMLRPNGPYLIGGHCYGGVVAFEAVRQLMAEGESVALLFLFDTPTPGYPKIVAAWRSYSRVFTDLIRGLGLGRIGAKDTSVPASAESQPPLHSLHRRMMGAYRPQTLAVPIVHLIGDDVQMSTKVLNDPRLGWRDFAGLQFDVRRVPGDHVSIFSEDNAPGLAAEFMAALRAVEPETRASVMAAS